MTDRTESGSHRRHLPHHQPAARSSGNDPDRRIARLGYLTRFALRPDYLMTTYQTASTKPPCDHSAIHNLHTARTRERVIQE